MTTKSSSTISNEELMVTINSVQKSIEDLLELQRSTVVTIEVEEEETDNDEDDEEYENGIRNQIGFPNKYELDLISKLTGNVYTSTDWTMVPFMASNNLVDYGLRRWHPSSMLQLASTAVGRPLLVDHDMANSYAAKGFIVDAKVVRERTVEDRIIDGGGHRGYNQEIIQNEGYIWLFLNVAIPTGSDTAKTLNDRIHNDCSTGSKLDKPIFICPDCSAKYNRDVSFYENRKDSKGAIVYTCDHLIPSPWMLDMCNAEGIDVTAFNFSRYCTLGGERHELLEHSICNRGALPAASCLRS